MSLESGENPRGHGEHAKAPGQPLPNPLKASGDLVREKTFISAEISYKR